MNKETIKKTKKLLVSLETALGRRKKKERNLQIFLRYTQRNKLLFTMVTE